MKPFSLDSIPAYITSKTHTKDRVQLNIKTNLMTRFLKFDQSNFPHNNKKQITGEISDQWMLWAV